MPMYDIECTQCKQQQVDVYEPIDAPVVSCACGGQMVRAPWLSAKSSSHVQSDECDIWVKHGICNPDGSPRHYTSKARMKREAEKRGLMNYVVHTPPPGSDRSKHTVRWI